MATGPRLRRTRRGATVERTVLTEEAVEAMRADGLLSRVVRLPAPLEPPPPAPFLPSSQPAPATPRPRAAPARSAMTHRGPYDLCLDDGTRAPVTTAGLVVGRRRSSSSSAQGGSSARLEIDDTSRSLSREHARLVEGDDGVVHLVDLGSGNGTIVRHPDGTATELVPGQPVPLREGDSLHLGDISASLVRSATRFTGA
jgi:hypothetical protein